MNQSPHSKRNTNIIIGVIIVLALVVFFYMSGDDAPEGSLTIEQASPDAAMVGTRVLNLLNQIESLRIETTLFDATAYQTLVDYSVAIPELPVGRPNPFAPLPGVPASTQ